MIWKEEGMINCPDMISWPFLEAQFDEIAARFSCNLNILIQKLGIVLEI